MSAEAELEHHDAEERGEQPGMVSSTREISAPFSNKIAPASYARSNIFALSFCIEL